MAKTESVRRLSLEERLALMGLRDEAKDICKRFGVSFEEARSRTRTPHVAAARHALWAYLRTKGFSANVIAVDWGVHHTTVAEATRKLQEREAALNRAAK